MTYYPELRDFKSDDLLKALTLRLKTATGPDIGHRNNGFGGGVLSFRSAIEKACHENGQMMLFIRGITPVTVMGLSIYEESPDNRKGFMASVYDCHEFAYKFWDSHGFRDAYLDLFDDKTVAAWLSLLPQPVSIQYNGSTCIISWPQSQDSYFRMRVCTYNTGVGHHKHWRVARAIALVYAFERFVSLPIDEVLSKFSSHQQLDDAWTMAVCGRSGFDFADVPIGYDTGSQVSGFVRMTPELLKYVSVDYTLAPLF